jgi:hypothetical protein
MDSSDMCLGRSLSRSLFSFADTSGIDRQGCSRASKAMALSQQGRRRGRVETS